MKMAVKLVALVLAAGLCSGVPAADWANWRNRGQDQQRRQDDPRNWPARDFANATSLPGAICLYIRDPSWRNNQAEEMESKDLLGNDEVRAKLRGFTRLKISSDGSDAKGWPAKWLAQARGGAALVFCSSNLAQVVIHSRTRSKDELLRDADAVLKYVAEWKAAVEAAAKTANAKNEAQPLPPAAEKPAVPGLDGLTAKKDKKKPGSKDPQDE